MSQILPDFIVQRPEGFYCKYGDFYIDPLQPVIRALISHAHADHARAGHRQIYCTPATEAFMRYRYTRQPKESFRSCVYHQRFAVGAVSVCFIPAGHMLGSAQIVMEYDGIRYLYTGDYKLQSDDTCEPLAMVQSDVLITESTFADPQVVHPDPIAEILKINDQPNHILLGAYALGKAQRLTSLLNNYCSERRVLVHHGILPFHRIYESMGNVRLRYEPYNRKAMKTTDAHHIYLVPPLTFNSYYRATNVVRAFASGWKHLQQRNHMSLYISDHVDWRDILDYIAQVNPREIWTMHGDGRYLAEYFRDRIFVRNLASNGSSESFKRSW